MSTGSGFLPGLALRRWRAPSLTVLADAGQIGREEALPAQQLANGFVRRLCFQVDLEFFLCGEIPSFLDGGLLGSVGWNGVGHFFRFNFRPPGQVLAPVALRAPSARTCPSAL